MGLMDTLTRLRGSLHQRVLHSGPEAPAGPGSCLFLLTFMPLFMKVTLSLCSPNPCLTTFYLFHSKCHLARKACPDDCSITHCSCYQDVSSRRAGTLFCPLLPACVSMCLVILQMNEMIKGLCIPWGNLDT